MLWVWFFFFFEGKRKSLRSLACTEITNCFFKHITSLHTFDIQKTHAKFCQTLPVLLPTELGTFALARCGSFSIQPRGWGSSQEGRGRSACRMQPLPLHVPRNGSTGLLWVLTNNWETAEQRFISYNKSQVVLIGSFETLLPQICILLPHKHTGMGKTFLVHFLAFPSSFVSGKWWERTPAVFNETDLWLIWLCLRSLPTPSSRWEVTKHLPNRY